jgi:hypothetical protein
MATRLITILSLATLALAVTASSGTAASPVSGRIQGVVPHAAQPALQAPRLAKATGSAGSVGRAGSAVLTFDAAYQTVINRYLTDVAADSTGVDNVYAVDTQYYDDPGHVLIQYQSTFGGSYVDKDPLPANGCEDGLDTYCLTDQQLQSEIQTVLTAKGWHGGLDHIFFLMTPNGVGSCFDAFSGECTTNAFCAYHSFFVDSSSENVIYANEPDMGPPGGCTDPQQGFPNDPDADTTVNTISHEHNEAITDPLTDNSSLAWIAADGSENGDLCAYDFSQPPLGGTPGVDAYNQIINNHHYDLQPEYSNADNAGNTVGCVLKPGGASSPPTFGSGPLVYMGGPVMHTNTTYAIYWLPTARNTSPPVVTGRAVVNQTLTTSSGAWAAGGAPFSYQWQRCSSNGSSCVDISGATATTYKLTSDDGGHVVRSTVRATNVNGASQPAASAGTALVIDVPTAAKAPHVTGRARVGRKLSGSHGSWTYSPTYRYQWLRCNAHGGSCSSIRKATHSTYRLTKHDAGHRLRLRVTAANAAGSKTAISSTTARVSAAKR